jgi:large subunit ribosomal protein L15
MKFKRKKHVRMHGGQTHGWGAKKKRRGGGHRGGRGMGGTGKRADTKKPSIWNNAHYFGRVGFHSIRPGVYSVNLQYLEEHADSLVKKGTITKEGEFYIVNLHDLGYDKLVSKGRLTRKFKITCGVATERAIEKVKKASGDVTVAE